MHFDLRRKSGRKPVQLFFQRIACMHHVAAGPGGYAQTDRPLSVEVKHFFRRVQQTGTDLCNVAQGDDPAFPAGYDHFPERFQRTDPRVQPDRQPFFPGSGPSFVGNRIAGLEQIENGLRRNAEPSQPCPVQ